MSSQLKSAAALLILSICSPIASSQSQIYFVLGSDTAIWEGMGVDNYHDHYPSDLYTLPQRNAYKVMDPAFRSRFVDSYGQSVKMTWWMMQGNIFRFADNTNVPVPNTMTLYLMKRYHGNAVQQFGDELTLHYHTFRWSDENGDGKYCWNQAPQFKDCRDDFYLTLAQDLLEEETFPVSFRSGWHAMDNAWQQELNDLLPFNLDNDYPSVRKDTVEPIDNVYDWSRASAEFVPFHPSNTDYQVPGNGRGWNTRSIHMQSISQAQMDHIFAQAASGIDQVPCLWAHLPETNFLNSIERVDSLIHISAARYPTVKFRYCTAIEAMQRWLRTTDHTPPSVTFQEENQGNDVRFTISTDEPIFQAQPFVAVKDVCEQYTILPCSSIGTNAWRTTTAVPRSTLARAAVAVSDTTGNQSIRTLRYLPDDVYVDDLDAAYHEVRGSWGAASGTAWGTSARSAQLGGSDTARIRWTPAVSGSVRYNLFVQIPATPNPARDVRFEVYSHGIRIDSALFADPLPAGRWFYVCSPVLDSGGTPTIEMSVSGSGQAGKSVAADVLKLSPLIRDKELHIPSGILEFGTVSQFDTVQALLILANRGIGVLRVNGISCNDVHLSCSSTFPLPIAAMSNLSLPIRYLASTLGSFADTLRVMSDDPVTERMPLPYTIFVSAYFRIADNADSLSYQEVGTWHTSNAQAYGSSSRFCYVTDPAGSRAVFSLRLRSAGWYDVQFIVPTTVNAATKALYLIDVGARRIDSLVRDQNVGSGAWARLGQYQFPADSMITVSVVNTGASGGTALRADAVRIMSVAGTTSASGRGTNVPEGFRLDQNYPNPFNPSTTIRYALPVGSHVTLSVYNMLGQQVAELVNGEKVAGTYEARFDGGGLASGVYLCRIFVVPAARRDLVPEGAGPHGDGQARACLQTLKLILGR